jgi:hypothetical protein
MKAKTVTKKDRDKKLLTVDVSGGGDKAEGDDDEEKKEGEGDAATETPNPIATTTGGDTKGGIGGIGGGLGGLGGKQEEEEAVQETVDDRTFICLGKSVDGLDTRYIWVMTINRDWDTVTFWEVKNHKCYVLKGRIEAG